jgi:hypothetical protein
LEGDNNATFALDAAAVRSVAVRVKVPPMSLTPGSHPIHFVIQNLSAGADSETASVTESSTFVMPR